MKSRISVITASILLILLPSLPARVSAVSQWRVVSQGLYERTRDANNRSFIEYRATNLVGHRGLVTMLAKRHAASAEALRATTSGRGQILDIAGGECTGSGFAAVGTAVAKLTVRASCTTGLALTGGITLYPPPGMMPGGTKSYSGTGSLYGFWQSNNPNYPCSQHGLQCPTDPDSWVAEEWWGASDGESGFYCEAGSDSAC